MNFLAVTSGPKGQGVFLSISAPTWFDARAYASRLLGVDPMGLRCTVESRPLPMQHEIEWRGSDYSDERRLWVRSRDRGGRWQKWRLA